MTLYSGHIFMYVFMPAHITKTASIDRVSSCPRHCLVEGLGTCGLPQDSRNLWDRLSVALSSRKGSESEMLWRCWAAQLDLNPSNLAAGSALVSLEVGHALCLLPSIYGRGGGGVHAPTNCWAPGHGVEMGWGLGERVGSQVIFTLNKGITSQESLT